MEGDSTTRVDSIMLAAMAQTDYPSYLIEDLVSSGGMKDVYRKMDERRAYKPAGLSVEDIAHILSEVLDERASEGLRKAEPKDDEESEVGGHAGSSSGLFPVHGSRDAFPPPVMLKDVEAQPLPGQRFQDSSALDIPSIQANVVLLRAEMLLKRWREGKSTQGETLAALEKVMEQTRP